MRLIYFCDCCQEILEDVDVGDIENPEQDDSLTEEEWQGIMKMHENQGTQRFVSTLCHDCIQEMGLGDDGGITYKALLH
ncbi:MAG: hypothetical protein M0021_15445 [Clostridia bacterium]|nr:hypothetical protein [Clostridia bacterium]